MDKQELQKVTLNLFRGDFDAVRVLHPAIGAGSAIRQIVRGYIRKVESKADQPLAGEVVEEINVEVL